MVRYERQPWYKKWLPVFNGPQKPHYKRLGISLLFWVCAMSWMFFCVKVATFRYPKTASALPDLLFSIIPYVDLGIVPNVFLYTLILSLVIRIVLHPDGVAITRRFVTISGFIFLYRSITTIVTSAPDPSANCVDYTASWSFSSLLKSSCGDLMFSGNSVIFTLIALCWVQYTKSRWAFVVWLFSLGGMICLIINRSHYTIDVIMAIFVTVVCWHFYHLALLLPPESRLRLVKWLEQLDFGASEADQQSNNALHITSRDAVAPSNATTIHMGSPTNVPLHLQPVPKGQIPQGSNSATVPNNYWINYR